MKNLIVLSIVFILSSCLGGQSKNNKAEEAKTENKRIEMPQMPTVFTSDEQRGEYLAMHFWDNFDFKDTTYINLPDITEQYFVDYINLLNHLPAELGERSIKSVADKASENSEMYTYFNGLFEKYLYEPNSPMRNEELYIPVLQKLLSSNKVGELEKIRPRAQLEMAMKNRPGHKAADISITLASGKTIKLYDVKSDFVLLYINNPDCPACRELTRSIKESDMIMPLVKQGVLKIVVLYTDEDIDLWRKHQDDFPADWINGYDKKRELRAKDIYDLKAIPTLYLLDRSKHVLIKDAATIMPVEYYFQSIGF